MVITKSISAEDTYSDSAEIRGDFNFSLSGTWAATVYVQRAYDGGTTWRDVESFTSNGEFVGNEPEPDVQYRFGVKTGGYSSGTVVGRLSK